MRAQDNGRGRHLAVDTEGWLLALVVTAASVSDKAGARLLIIRLFNAFSTLQIMWADSGYDGKPLARYAQAVAAITVEVVKRTSPHSFQVLRRRWVVERTFGWLMRYRRLVRDYERRPENHEAMVYWATVLIMTRRLARYEAGQPPEPRWGGPRKLPESAPETARNPLSTGSKPLSLKEARFGPQALSFTDGLSGETTYHYHVPLEYLRPDTTYYYKVTDGATPPSTASGSFTTAPAGRAKFRFSSYGDIGQPTSASKYNVTGYSWNSEASNDTCVFEVDATITPSDGGPVPLFHLINGDLSYADNDPANTPSVWRDFSVNVSRSAAFRPWMPTLGNHEQELGVDAQDGSPSTSQFWNGAYGNGNYQARYMLPNNGVTNYDGNHLQGQFYSFQVGTVLFIALDADDVTLQNVQTSTSSQITYDTGVTVPAGLVHSGHEYTGDLEFTQQDYSIVPAGPQPNKQTLWLERTLHAARLNPTIDIIVVSMHQASMSTSTDGNGTDMGIRATWDPLFDKYEVDLVLHGHEHDYERSYPVRGFDATAGTVTTAFTSSLNGAAYAVGDTIDTRRPHVVTTTPETVNGIPAWDTAKGTVHLILGGGGASATNVYGDDTATGLPQANVWVTLDGRDAVEDAPWSAARDATDAHGYAYFDVDPGDGPGKTTIIYQWFQVPTVPSGGSITLPTTPYEKFVFGRNLSRSGL